MKPKKSNRFVCAEISGGGFANRCEVLVDRQTGVNYLFVASGYSGGLTVMLDAQGNPIVTPVPPEDQT